MKMTTAREMLRVFSTEQQKRRRRVRRLDAGGDEFAWEIHKFEDEPFIADLCLALLTVIWHQVERDLVRLAARVGPSDDRLSFDEYRTRVRQQREEFRKGKTQARVLTKLNVQRMPAWTGTMKALRLLANCYKHDPEGTPGPELLDHLRLPPIPAKRHVVRYGRLAESEAFREGLAVYLHLKSDARFTEITSAFIVEAEVFLTQVAAQKIFSSMGGVSLAGFSG